jgi:hypothetical protein
MKSTATKASPKGAAVKSNSKGAANGAGSNSSARKAVSTSVSTKFEAEPLSKVDFEREDVVEVTDAQAEALVQDALDHLEEDKSSNDLSMVSYVLSLLAHLLAR